MGDEEGEEREKGGIKGGPNLTWSQNKSVRPNFKDFTAQKIVEEWVCKTKKVSSLTGTSF